MLSFILASFVAFPPSEPTWNMLPPREPKTFKWAITETPARVGTVTRTVVSYRQPVGHTHTCSSCQVTWDHQANASHSCPNCKRQVLIQDRIARPVTVTRTVTESVVTQPTPTMNSIRVPVKMPNCPNGNCPLVR